MHYLAIIPFGHSLVGANRLHRLLDHWNLPHSWLHSRWSWICPAYRGGHTNVLCWTGANSGHHCFILFYFSYIFLLSKLFGRLELLAGCCVLFITLRNGFFGCGMVRGGGGGQTPMTRGGHIASSNIRSRCSSPASKNPQSQTQISLL